MSLLIPDTFHAIPWQSTIDYSALLILTKAAPPLFAGYKNVTHDVVVVILSKAKDLKASVTVAGPTEL